MIDIDQLLNTEYMQDVEHRGQFKARVLVHEHFGYNILAGFPGEYLLMINKDFKIIRLSLNSAIVYHYDAHK